MATDHFTLAFLTPKGIDLPDSKDLSGIDLFRDEFLVDGSSMVCSKSRRDVLSYHLRRLLAVSDTPNLSYFFEDFIVIVGEDLVAMVDAISGLLEAVEKKPDLVVDVTKEKYDIAPSKIVCESADMYINVVTQYPSDWRIEDGWIYPYSADDVLSMLKNAKGSTKDMPEVDRDEDGESFEYLFAVLKSHLLLANEGIRQDLQLVFENCGGYNG